MSNLPSLNSLPLEDDAFEQEEAAVDPLAEGSHRPYDPRLIRVEPKMFSLRNIMDMIADGEIDLAPDFQRLTVWSQKQKSRLIESILLRIPLPAFYFASDEDGLLQVVDGVQRLSTIYDFVRDDGFELVKLEYLADEVGEKRYSKLENTIWAKRINNTQIVANVIDPQTPMPVKFDIFKRINTGGTPLNSQEIRHCMSGPRSRELLLRVTATEAFGNATGGLAGHVRMADREMALRVLAFALLGTDEFLESDGLDDFLNRATSKIEDYADHDLLALAFERAMRHSYTIFGDHAFRKWPIGASKRSPINRAIFETVGTLIMTHSDGELRQPDEIRFAYRQMCTTDQKFLSSVTQSTGSALSVLERFDALRRVMTK